MKVTSGTTLSTRGGVTLMTILADGVRCVFCLVSSDIESVAFPPRGVFLVADGGSLSLK